MGDNVVIGDNTIIFAGRKDLFRNNHWEKLYNSFCAIVGADGFGFAPNENGEYSKVPQIGNVILEDMLMLVQELLSTVLP